MPAGARSIPTATAPVSSRATSPAAGVATLPVSSPATGAATVPLRAATALLMAWHDPGRRSFAFRQTTDPWAVLVSEVMLQQTQAPRVEEHWRWFMARFPTPAALAAASVGDVLRAWQGLGYNRRALSLHRAANAVVERHGGVVPASLDELEALPGVGPYTARAVAAIAFGVQVAALDTNIRRIVGRVAHGRGRDGDPGRRVSDAVLQASADAMVDEASPRAWTLAAMDLGATICRPRAPRCGECPLVTVCRYSASAAPGPAAPGAPSAAARTGPETMRFESSRRWLRGRLIDRLRGERDGAWVRIQGPLGAHDADAVSSALAALELEGLVERAEDGSVRLPA